MLAYGTPRFRRSVLKAFSFANKPIALALSHALHLAETAAMRGALTLFLISIAQFKLQSFVF